MFARSFDDQGHIVLPNEEERELTEKVIANLEKIDKTISAHAPKYPLDKIAKTDLSILRLAVYELIIDKQEPTKVIINEAVELGKELGNDRSFAFVNAVLGSILTDITDTKEV